MPNNSTSLDPDNPLAPTHTTLRVVMISLHCCILLKLVGGTSHSQLLSQALLGRTSPISSFSYMQSMSYNLPTPIPHKVITSKKTVIKNTTVYFSDDIPMRQPNNRNRPSSSSYHIKKAPQPIKANQPNMCRGRSSKSHSQPTSSVKATTDNSTQTTSQCKKVRFCCDC